jgi:hypothetical protein
VGAITIADVRELAETLLRESRAGQSWASKELLRILIGSAAQSELAARIAELETHLLEDQ